MRGQAIHLEWLDFPDVVAVLPFNEAGEIVLVEQYRAPVGRWTVEVPAGAANPGEAPREAALRELAEETGFRAGSLDPLASFYPAIGYSSERIDLFLARDLTPGPTQFDEGEEIRVLTRTPDQVEAMVRSGEIGDSKSIIAFMAWRYGVRLGL